MSAGLDGINVSGAQSNITIKNGSVRTCADDGIDAANADTVRIQDITSRNNTSDGIVVGPDSMVLNCTVAHNTGNGINTADNCTLENCIARENGGVGFDVDANSQVSRCTARANGTFGISTDANCSVIGSVLLRKRQPRAQRRTGQRRSPIAPRARTPAPASSLWTARR